MRLTTEEAKHLLQDIESRQEYDTLCEMEVAILCKVRAAHPLAVAELELQQQRHSYEQLARYNGELVKALEAGQTWEDFRKERQTK